MFMHVFSNCNIGSKFKDCPREEAVARGVKSFYPGHTSLSVADGLLSWSCRVVYSHVSQCAKGILFAC